MHQDYFTSYFMKNVWILLINWHLSRSKKNVLKYQFTTKYLGTAAAAPPAGAGGAGGAGGEGEEEEIPAWCNPEDPMGAWLLFKVDIDRFRTLDGQSMNYLDVAPDCYVL